VNNKQRFTAGGRECLLLLLQWQNRPAVKLCESSSVVGFREGCTGGVQAAGLSRSRSSSHIRFAEDAALRGTTPKAPSKQAAQTGSGE